MFFDANRLSDFLPVFSRLLGAIWVVNQLSEVRTVGKHNGAFFFADALAWFPFLVEEGDQDSDTWTCMPTFILSKAIAYHPQDNAGKTTLLYRLKVCYHYCLSVCQSSKN